MTPSEFKKLKAKWDRRLAESGFHDIENAHGYLTDHQTALDFSQRIGFKADLVGEIYDYYSWAGEMFWYGKFESPLDKKIWRLHAAGKPTRDIGLVVRRHQSTVVRSIERIREYLKKQRRPE